MKTKRDGEREKEREREEREPERYRAGERVSRKDRDVQRERLSEKKNRDWTSRIFSVQVCKQDINKRTLEVECSKSNYLQQKRSQIR